MFGGDDGVTKRVMNVGGARDACEDISVERGSTSLGEERGIASCGESIDGEEKVEWGGDGDEFGGDDGVTCVECDMWCL